MRAPLTERLGARVYLAALVVVGAAACFAPLADHLGYELAELIALTAGALGAAPGVAAARRELDEGPDGRASRALGSALALAIAGLAIPVVLVLLNGLRRPACEPLRGMVMVLALAVPSAGLSAALGVACGFFAQRGAAALFAAVFLGSLAVALWPVAFGPQVFAFHHLGGMFPGPIYDEAVGVREPLVWFRAATILWTAAACGAALLAGPRGSPAAGAVMLALGGAGGLAISLSAERLHFRAGTDMLARGLGGVIETPRLVLRFPREKPEPERRALAEQAEADLRTVRAFLGLAPEPPPGAPRIEVFFHRSAEEKRKLLGAAETSFTKPWLRQVHTNDERVPHRILRHELAHAAAAELSGGALGVPGRLRGLWPSMALVEGLAVAADWPGGELTVHEQARALRGLGLAPDLRRLFGAASFFGESGARAYTTVGSFVRWLWTTQGAAAVARAYSGEPLPDVEKLAADHARFLDAMPLPARAEALEAQRFRAPGIVRKRCPHEVAELSREAVHAEPSRAVELWGRCARMEPDDPNLLLGLRRAQLAAGRPDEARATEERALSHPKLGMPQRAQLLVEAGDQAWEANDEAAALARYREAARLHQWEPQQRALEARLAALPDREAWPAVRRLFAGGDAGPLTWLLIERWARARPFEGLPPYLLAKQMQNRGDWAECAQAAREALERRLPGQLFLEEGLRMRAVCSWRAGDLATARAAFHKLGEGAPPGRAREVEDWLSRLPRLEVSR